VYFRVEPGRLPHQYEPSFARQQTGITLYKVQGVAIVDLVVEAFRSMECRFTAQRAVPADASDVPGQRAGGIAVVNASRRRSTTASSANGQSQLHIEDRPTFA
jgi:hypothetical protein